MPLQQLNKTIKQLKFLQPLPDQDKVVEAIINSLGKGFVVKVYSEPYLTQINLTYCGEYWDMYGFSETYKYQQGNSSNHKVITLMNVLIKARNYYATQTLPTTNS